MSRISSDAVQSVGTSIENLFSLVSRLKGDGRRGSETAGLPFSMGSTRFYCLQYSVTVASTRGTQIQ